MKNVKRSIVLTSQAGFSLVELMVVVAIIGILAAMSVGQVQKQIAKARQSEAKTNLASIYTAEKSLYAEYTSYSGDFGTLSAGFEGNLRYNVGFGAAFIPIPPGYTATNQTGVSSALGYCPGVPCAIISSNGVAPAASAGVGAANTFTADAHAFIYLPTIDDTWTVNDNKQYVNTVAGIQ